MGRKFNLVHHRNDCIGCGSCELEAPQDWTLETEDGKSELKGAKCKNGVYIKEIDEFDLPSNQRACKNCPVNIIKIHKKGKSR